MAIDPQLAWSEYYTRKYIQRTREAAAVWQTIASSGATKETILAIDFVHCGSGRECVESLCSHLTGNYIVDISARGVGYWIAKGTTRPFGIAFTQEKHLEWVRLMRDVSRSYGCVFSTWALDAPSIGSSARSEDVESDG